MCTITTVENGREHSVVKYGKLKSLMVLHGLVPEKCSFPTDLKVMNPEVGEWLAAEILDFHGKKKPTSDSPSSTEPKIKI